MQGEGWKDKLVKILWKHEYKSSVYLCLKCVQASGHSKNYNQTRWLL